MAESGSLNPFNKVLVTGATGFIGSHLVRALVSSGCNPTLLCRSRKERAVARLGDGVRWLTCDLTDVDLIGEIIAEEMPAAIFHLAGTRGGGNGFEACKELNLNATARVLDAATRSDVRRVVILGSAEEYGNQSGPLLESLPTRATSPYGISKAIATAHALAMHAQNGCPVVVLRPFSVYGPGQPRNMFVAQAVDSAVRNVEFKMSRGEQRRDLIFVDDVVSALIAAASAKDVEGCTINLGAGEAHRLRDVAESIWKISGATAPLLAGARNAFEDELYDTWADITLAKRLLKWEPQVNLETGLRRTIDSACAMGQRPRLTLNHVR